MTWSLRPVPVPPPDSSSSTWLFDGSVEVDTQSVRDAWGHDDMLRTRDALAVWYAAQEYAQKLCLVAVRDDPAETPDPARVLGVAMLVMPRQDNTHRAVLDVAVRPRERGAGLGAALHAAAVDLATAEGRTHLAASTGQHTEPAPGPGALDAATGQGRVARDHPGVRFARSRGYVLEQVYRSSVLEVPLAREVLVEHRAKAEAAAGPDYRTVSWDGRCPDRWVDDFAHLLTRMSTDAPSAGIEVEEAVWDAARVMSQHDMFERRGSRYRVTAAEHVPSGRLVGFTAFQCEAHTDEYVEQDDTLVLREHRGHRLGLLVKVVNLQRLAGTQPAARRVGTWNAQENAAMLAINVELGFRPAGGSGEWQLRLG